ncbi:MAG: hypothetical protein JXJ04_01800 [Spirochaetales bacterium]|nr:hypothetical protein [Spirochaetales bacterium]
MKKYFIFGAIILFVLLMTNSCIIFVGGDGTLRIVNDSEDYEIYEVYIVKNADSSGWGDDWLDADEIIDIFESRTFTLDSGEYDVRIVDSVEWNAYEYNVEIDPDSTTTLHYDGYNLDK